MVATTTPLPSKLLKLIFYYEPPVGSRWVDLESDYHNALLLLVEGCKQLPQLQINLYLNGVMLDFLLLRHPEVLRELRALQRKGQLEMLSGGYYSPVLVDWSESDQVGQITKMNDFHEQHFGETPRGLWLTQGVWESHLIPVLRRCGLRYTPLPVELFFRAGIHEPHGHYTAEHLEQIFWVLPDMGYAARWSSEARYSDGFPKITFAGESITLSMNLALWNGEALVGALKRFPLQSSMCLMGAWVATCRAEGSVELPSGTALEEHQAGSTNLSLGEISKLQPSVWAIRRSRYANSVQLLHKVRRLRLLAERMGDASTVSLLWQAQHHASYHHADTGGGLNLPHLRTAAWLHTLNAERLLLAYAQHWHADRADKDGDGYDEVSLSCQEGSVAFVPARGGSCRELSCFKTGVNLLNVFSPTSNTTGSMEAVGFGGFVDHFFNLTDDEPLAQRMDCGDFAQGVYQVVQLQHHDIFADLCMEREGTVSHLGKRHAVWVRKKFTFSGCAMRMAITYEVINKSREPLHTLFAIENNWMLSGESPNEDLLFVDSSNPSLLQSFEAKGIGSFRVRSPQTWLEAEMLLDTPMDFLSASIRTPLANGESRRQGNQFWLFRRLQLKPDDIFYLQLHLHLKKVW